MVREEPRVPGSKAWALSSAQPALPGPALTPLASAPGLDLPNRHPTSNPAPASVLLHLEPGFCSASSSLLGLSLSSTNPRCHFIPTVLCAVPAPAPTPSPQPCAQDPKNWPEGVLQPRLHSLSVASFSSLPHKGLGSSLWEKNPLSQEQCPHFIL